MMPDLDQILASGDRVEFKKYIASCTLPQLVTAWIRSKAIQDFGDLAFDEIQRRGA